MTPIRVLVTLEALSWRSGKVSFDSNSLFSHFGSVAGQAFHNTKPLLRSNTLLPLLSMAPGCWPACCRLITVAQPLKLTLFVPRQPPHLPSKSTSFSVGDRWDNETLNAMLRRPVAVLLISCPLCFAFLSWCRDGAGKRVVNPRFDLWLEGLSGIIACGVCRNIKRCQDEHAMISDCKIQLRVFF